MTTLPRRRAGFTLVELLMVITIIMILASATFGLYRGVSNTRMKARGRGEIQRIIIACENFKKTYGDYPCAANGTSVSTSAPVSSFRTDLFDQLSGRRIIYTWQLPSPPAGTGGFAVELLSYNHTKLPNGANRNRKPFVAFEDIPISVSTTPPRDALPVDLAEDSNKFEFRDPWGNPYEYRYRVLSSPGVNVQNLTSGGYNPTYGNWLSANFLLVSCGPNFALPTTEGSQPNFNEYFITGSDMVKTGIIPTGYFDDADPAPQRSDNIVNWSN